MKRQKTKQKESGFAHIGIVIAVILVVAALTFVGWLVWEKSKKDNTTQSSNNSQTQEQTNNEEQPIDPSEGGKYLVIKEWGVRFLLPEELRGDMYYKTAKNEITKLERASFASNKLDSLLGNFSCSFKENPQIDGISSGLLRLAPEHQPPAQVFAASLNELKRLKDYEYFTNKQASPPITCLTNQHEEFSNVEQSISDQLRDAFKTMESL